LMKYLDKNSIYFPILLVLLLFEFCSGNDKYADFEKDESGLRYKFIEKGKSEERFHLGDYIEMELLYKNQQDSVLFNSKELRTPFRMQLRNLSHQGGCFENALLLASPGDKMMFVLKADSFYNKTQRKNLPKGVDSGSDLLFELKIIRKLNPEELKAEWDSYLLQLKEQEDVLIRNYIEDNDIKTEPTLSGLYFTINKKGNGPKARKGNVLTVHYTGKFLDGRVFDSSYKRNETFDFELGAGQVIDAWEEACSEMNEGDKVTLIVPSKLAYGAEGFSNLIPPYSPLIFEIELLVVN